MTTRLQRRRLAAKRRWVLASAVAAMLTVGVLVIIIFVALNQRVGTLAWFGNWAFALHQAVMFVVHLRATRRAHVEHAELIEEYSRQQKGEPGR